jgi:uncharacterized membrane protein
VAALNLLLTLVLLWTLVAGITLVAHRYIEDLAIARTTGLLLVVLALFFVEHFIGLGSLYWLMPPLVLLGGWLLWKKLRGERDKTFLEAEAVFVLALLYGLFWRWSYPDISPASEKITDLYFISNYYPGFTLPPPDNWYPPQVFDHYYALQHYAAALLGRLFGLQIGVTYNLAFVLLMALPLTLAWSLSARYIQTTALRILLLCSLAFGGTGLGPLLHLAMQAPVTTQAMNESGQTSASLSKEQHAWTIIINNVRFIGEVIDRGFQDNSDSGTMLASILFPAVPEGPDPPMVLPAENYGYHFFLGDYHPPIGGFLLLLLALATMASVDQSRQQRLGQGIVALTVPAMLVTNAWLLPLQVLLILAWLLLRWTQKRELHWAWLFGGAVLGSLLIQPFLQGFSSAAPGMSVKLVTAAQHTPPSRFLALHWPFLLLALLALFEPRQRRLALGMAGTWLVLLLLPEFIYMDDVTAAQYERTKTTMKWWGWVHTGMLISIGALCLGSSVKWLRWSTVALLLVLNIIVIDLAHFWFHSGRYQQGELNGHAWYTQDPVNRQMFEYLQAAPPGIVLESLPDNAYMNSSIHAIFNGKQALLGWPSHLMTWHGDVPRVWLLKEEIERFYRGELDDPLGWLASHDVRYIVFGPMDDQRYFNAINDNIGLGYTWHAYSRNSGRQTGIWVKQEQGR